MGASALRRSMGLAITLLLVSAVYAGVQTCLRVRILELGVRLGQAKQRAGQLHLRLAESRKALAQAIGKAERESQSRQPVAKAAGL